MVILRCAVEIKSAALVIGFGDFRASKTESVSGARNKRLGGYYLINVLINGSLKADGHENNWIIPQM